MPPVSHQARLTEFLKGCTNQRAKRSEVMVGLSAWMDAAQADRAINEALEDKRSLITTSWGNTIVYWGLENRSTKGLYDAVGRAFVKYWGPHQFGLKSLKGDDAIVAQRPKGKPQRDWAMPDLVVFAHPRRKRSATSPREIHSFEIEQHNGFKIQSIYQAYEQARGANYAWVFAHSDQIPDQFAVAAKELGVGVVVFGNPNSSVTYSKANASILAKRRDVSNTARRHFLETVSLPDIG